MHESERTARVGVERVGRKKKQPLDHLTRDVLAAEKAGMSYGKWKALHPNTPEEDDEEEEKAPSSDEVVCNCKNCFQPFVKLKSKKNKVFCSTVCQSHYNARKQQAKTRATTEKLAACRICGKVFMADYRHRVYCGTECYRKGQQARRAERLRQARQEEKKND